MRIELITLKERHHILELLDQCPKKDIHNHPDYLRLFEDYTKQKAVYVYYGDRHNFLLIPFFKRSILLFGVTYFDLISPWYYGGSTTNSTLAFENFNSDFSQYCKANNIISEFQRFNPILENHMHYPCSFNRKLIYVDLTKTKETLIDNYERHVRKNLNKAERDGLSVNRNKDLRSFIKLYTESMKRKNARTFYYFNETFFKELYSFFEDDVQQFNVELNGKIISSSIELGKYGILHDYLRGSDPEYFEHRPNDILLHTAIQWAKLHGYTHFVLGGGNKPTEEDTQYRFKRSFSADTCDFYLYKKVHKKEDYERLCNVQRKNDLKYEQADYFPEYIIPEG